MSKKLDEIKARLAAATPGPWASARYTPRLIGVGRQWKGASFFVSPQPDERLRDIEHDADLIAHAPADLDLLVEAVERLQSKLAEAGRRLGAQSPEEWLGCVDAAWLRERGLLP